MTRISDGHEGEGEREPGSCPSTTQQAYDRALVLAASSFILTAPSHEPSKGSSRGWIPWEAARRSGTGWLHSIGATVGL
jgi:hypothetical protein